MVLIKCLNVKKKSLLVFLASLAGLALTLAIATLVAPLFARADAQKPRVSLKAVYDETVQAVICDMTVDYVNASDETQSFVCFNLPMSAFREGATQKTTTASERSRVFPDSKNAYGGIVIGSVSVEGREIAESKDNSTSQTALIDGGQNGSESAESSNAAKNRITDCPTDGFSLLGTDCNALAVPLAKTLYPNERARVDVSFTTALPLSRHRLGYNDISVNLGNFFPTLCVFDNGFVACEYAPFGDPFFTYCADFDVELAVPKDFVVALSAKVTDTTDTVKSELIPESGEEPYAIYRSSGKNMRDFACVLSRDLIARTGATKCGATVTYYCPSACADEADAGLCSAVDAVNTFSDLFGDYAYETLAVVKCGFSVGGGMEYPALCMISDEITNGRALTEVIAHETAHQWWYGGVGNDQISEAWLDEGLTDYSVGLFYEENPSYGVERSAYTRSAENSVRIFCDVFGEVAGETPVDISIGRSLDEFNSPLEYSTLVYSRANMMFCELEAFCGNRKKSTDALRRYYRDNLFGIACAGDLAAAYEKFGKRGAADIIKKYL